MSDEIIATVRAGNRREIRVYFNESGQIVIRTWFESKEGGWRPSKEGITVKRSVLPEVLAGLEKAGAAR